MVVITSTLLVTLIAGAAAVLAHLVLRRPASFKRKTSIPLARTLSWVPIPGFSFYTQRNDWLHLNHGDPLKGGLAQTATRFHVRNHQVLSLAGPEAARTFYLARPLSFQHGWSFKESLPSQMYIGVPAPGRLQRERAKIQADVGKECLKKAITTDRLREMVPIMIDDCLNLYATSPWPSHDGKGAGLLDMYEDIFTLVAQLSMRSFGFEEAASNLETVKQMTYYYWMADEAANFFSVHLPFIPLPGIIKRIYGALCFYRMHTKIIRKRLADGRRADDVPQTLIDKGIPNRMVVGFVVGALVGAMINGSSMAGWMLHFVGANESLRTRLREEAEQSMRKHTAEKGLIYEDLTLAERLKNVPLEAWEADFQLSAACLKETMRLYTAATAYRFFEGDNLSKSNSTPTVVQGQQLEEGDILSMWVGATHYNSSIYSNPLAFDPDRWARGEGSGKFDFLGWGQGLHSCQGMRFAKLELKILCATFVTTFDFESVDLQGNPYTLDTLPRVNPNAQENHLRKPEKPIRLRLRRLR